ncbi:MAG: AAA family ATPase, partial [Thermoleophilaceae bacterium]
IGYDEGGQLTEAVRRKPYSVLLLDEIEKAHPDVFNILLQILEDGRLTDAQGRTVDFRNAIVIMTSNIGASEIAKNTGVGFTVGDETGGLVYEDMKNRIMGELKKVFRPEFLNRIDEVIVFHKLEKSEIRQIVELLLKRVRESLADRELSLNLSEDATDLLVEKGWDPAMGARPLRRAIQRYVEDPIADEVLKAGMEPGSNVEIDRVEESERPDGDEDERPEVKISITAPVRKKEAVGVGAEGGSPEGEDDDGSGEGDDEPKGSAELPEDPDVLPDVPDAPPPPEDDSGSGDDDSK